MVVLPLIVMLLGFTTVDTVVSLKDNRGVRDEPTTTCETTSSCLECRSTTTISLLQLPQTHVSASQVLVQLAGGEEQEDEVEEKERKLGPLVEHALSNHTEGEIHSDPEEEEQQQQKEEEEEEATEQEDQEEQKSGGTHKAISKNCTTQQNPLAVSKGFAKIAPPGTHCVFGVDVRDEGLHCIATQPGNDDWGSFGWCWTDEAHSTWGSCSADCPLAGAPKLLGTQVDRVGSKLDRLKAELLARMEKGWTLKKATAAKKKKKKNMKQQGNQ